MLTALRMEPIDWANRGADPAPDRVEVTLVTDEATFAAMTAALDRLIGDYDLVAHVRHGVKN